MLWHFRTIFVLAKSFGLKRGLSIYLNRLFVRRSDGVVSVLSLPGVAGEIYYRPRSTDWSVMSQVFINKEYTITSEVHEAALQEYYQKILGEGGVPVILDCGANIGLASIWYVERFPKAKILAVEVEDGNFAVLQKNAEVRANIIPVHAAVFDRTTQVSLSNDGGGAWAWQARESDEGSVRTVTVPELVGRIPAGKLFIVKIDIEGGEAELFRSNTQWVDEAPLIVIETHDLGFPWRGTAHAVFAALSRKKRDYLYEGENVLAFSHALNRSSACDVAEVNHGERDSIIA